MSETDIAVFDQIRERCDKLRNELKRVIVGQETIVEQLLVALLCQGHVLVVGVPGLAKTLLVRTLSRAMELSFRRIQFTPDMMPSDILGTELIQDHDGHRELKFVPGPIFAQLILADEINRTPPKTQAALLEAMAEHQVTVAGRTMSLEEPFIVVATQNPIEQEGTYPLPEAQLDRFMFSLWMDYPTKDQEIDVVDQTPRIMSERVDQVFDCQTLIASSSAILQMPVSRHIVEYAVTIARATRPDDEAATSFTKQFVEWGAGPRSGQYLVHAARAMAAMAGEPTPNCDHVRNAAMSVLRHRVVPNYAATGDGIGAKEVVEKVLEQVNEPDYS